MILPFYDFFDKGQISRDNKIAIKFNDREGLERRRYVEKTIKRSVY